MKTPNPMIGRFPMARLTLNILLTITIIIGCIFIVAASTLDQKSDWFDETGITNGVGICHFLKTDYIFRISGTFDSATVTLQTAEGNLGGKSPAGETVSSGQTAFVGCREPQ